MGNFSDIKSKYIQFASIYSENRKIMLKILQRARDVAQASGVKIRVAEAEKDGSSNSEAWIRIFPTEQEFFPNGILVPENSGIEVLLRVGFDSVDSIHKIAFGRSEWEDYTSDENAVEKIASIIADGLNSKIFD